MIILRPIERKRLHVFFLYILQMLNVSIFGNTADIYAILHLVPHACQNITVDQSHNSGDTVTKILEISGEWRHKDGVLHKPPEKKSCTGLNPGTGVATALTRHLHSFFAWSYAMHRQPSSRNFAYHFLILLKTDAAFWNSARNRRCTVITDEVLKYSKTQKD
jgi:hypothetical protein